MSAAAAASAARAAHLAAWAIPGIPEVSPGDDLAALIGDALEDAARSDPEMAPRDGDILSVTSKVVSKAEGRVIVADDREDAITAQTVRVVATRPRADGGVTRIVENPLGIVAAAAGVDASNTADGTVLLLPEDPDATARTLRSRLRARFGARLGVVVTDTLGRPWRIGHTDAAIGAAGVTVVEDLRGSKDSAGRTLHATLPAIADEIAALTDLVKGKASGRPVALVRGLGRYVTESDGPGARALIRPSEEDLFRLGAAEAYAAGFEAGMSTRGSEAGEPHEAAPESNPGVSAPDDAGSIA